MSTTSSQPLPKREVLEKNLIEKIGKIPDEGVAMLHKMAQELELRMAWEEFSSEIGKDWAAGKYDDLDEVIEQIRHRRPEPTGA